MEKMSMGIKYPKKKNHNSETLFREVIYFSSNLSSMKLLKMIGRVVVFHL